MPTITTLKPTRYPNVPLGIVSLMQFVNSHGSTEIVGISTGVKIVEISKGAKPFKTDVHDPAFDRPIAELTKIYPD